MTVKNIFENIPDNLSAELFTTLVDSRVVKIERIVSQGHATQAAHWYDQQWHEWVFILQGSASLTIDDQEDVRQVALSEGDHLLLPAHCRHTVEATHPTEKTIWLAVHFAPN